MTDRAGRPAGAWLWPILAVFVALHAVVVLFFANGPFLDEGIYAVAGLRLLEGHGLSDGYSSWFSGSPFVWPFFSGLGVLAGGLEGARLVALVFSTVTLAAFGRSAEALFGRPAAVWGTVAFAANGLFLALAHFAVYDVVALAALSVSLWLLTRWADLGETRWLVLAGVALGAAVIAKYGYAFMGAPLLLLAFSIAPAGRTWKVPAVLLGVAGSIAEAYFLVAFRRPWPRGAAKTYFSFPVAMSPRDLAAHHLVFAAVPLLLAVCGAVAVWRAGEGAGRGAGRLTVAACLGALLVWPAFHLATGTFVSAQKHVVSGFLFAYLLAGAGLARLWASRARWAAVPALAAVLAWGVVQYRWQEAAWPDVRPIARHLLREMRPGDRLVADSSWSLTFYLYPARLVASPYGVAEPRLVLARERDAALRATWLLGTGSPDDPVEAAAARGGYRLVLTTRSQGTWLDTRRLRLGRYPIVRNLYRAP